MLHHLTAFWTHLLATGIAVAQKGRGSYQGGKEQLRKPKSGSRSLRKAAGNTGKV